MGEDLRIGIIGFTRHTCLLYAVNDATTASIPGKVVCGFPVQPGPGAPDCG